uniref:ankyrin repeat and EF-hand domain-containing protein 1 n=1 Tax=Myxine glutinosa TaxID=7769 RepID=UPI00358F8D96
MEPAELLDSGEHLSAVQVNKLLHCVLLNQTAEVVKLVSRGVPGLVNLREPCSGQAALHRAATLGTLEMLQQFLSLGADVDIRDRNGHTALMVAAELGRTDVVSTLLSSGATTKARDAQGCGVTQYCMYPTQHHVTCLELVLEHNANPNTKSSQVPPPLVIACSLADQVPQLAMLLLSKRGNPNCKDQTTGRTALMEAARVGSAIVVKKLLQSGADVAPVDIEENNAVHLSMVNGSLPILQMLVGFGANVGVVNKNGDTPLHNAACVGVAPCCRFLIQRGCNPKKKNSTGALPLALAKAAGYRDAMKEIRKGEQTWGKTPRNKAPGPEAIRLFDWAWTHADEIQEALELTLDDEGNVPEEDLLTVLAGAPVDEADVQCILQIHSKEGCICLQEFLNGTRYLSKAYMPHLDAGRQRKKGKGQKQKKGKIPLPICMSSAALTPHAYYDRLPGYFIECGPHPLHFSIVASCEKSLQDDSAWHVEPPQPTFLEMSTVMRAGLVEALLLAFTRGVPVDVMDRYFKTPLMVACSLGNNELAQMLIQLGANISAQDNFGWTPLHHACLAGQEEVASSLLMAGANPNSPSLAGATPLMRAVQSGCVGLVRILLENKVDVQAVNHAGRTALDVANAYADTHIIKMIEEYIAAIPPPKGKQNKSPKGGKQRSKTKDAKVSLRSGTTPRAAE